MKTKRRKRKRFEFIELFSADCLFFVDNSVEKSWYFKEVICTKLGDFAYHTVYPDLFTVFHIGTGGSVGFTHSEKEARQVLKKLTKTEKMPEISERNDFLAWVMDVKRKSETLSRKLPDKNIYNPEEDIPF